MARLLSLPLLLFAAQAHAEPYLAVQTGFKCGQCHINPTGGGKRTVFGNVFAQTQLAATRLDTGGDLWTGEVNRFLSVGGDVRADYQVAKVPGSSATNEFDLQQARVYAAVNIIPQRLYVYVDELLSPISLNREAYGVYWSENHDWYVKAGQMYLPFGFRLQDNTAFVKLTTGVNMTVPDQGVEFGLERGRWDAQLAITNGNAGDVENNHGKQYSGQLQYVENFWRVGVAANLNSFPAGDRDAAGIFGGIRAGPVGFLAEVDYVDDKRIGADQGRQLASLVEANWRIKQGHNFKFTAEYLDPNRSASGDRQTRYSILYELTPIQFLQIRTGLRYSDAIPETPNKHLRLGFIELHAFF